MILQQEEFLKLSGESFDEGAKSALISLITTLEVLHTIYPNLSFAEVIDVIKNIKDKNEFLKE